MAGVSAREMCRVLEQHGFIFRRQSGSHRIYFNVTEERRVTVPMHNKDLPISTLHSILKQAGLKLEDL